MLRLLLLIMVFVAVPYARTVEPETGLLITSDDEAAMEVAAGDQAREQIVRDPTQVQVAINAYTRALMWYQHSAQTEKMIEIEIKLVACRKPVLAVIRDVPRVAIPPEEQRKAAVAELRALYKADYARRQPSLRRRFIAKLLTEAEQSLATPALHHAMLSEVIDLAITTPDFPAIARAAGHLAAVYRDTDAVALMRAAYTKAKPHPVAVALLRLLDNDADPSANAVVGRHWCFDLGLWPEGLPRLARGDDVQLAQAATLDLTAPVKAMDGAILGERWYELGRKTRSARDACFVRARTWLQQALPGLTGVSRLKAETLLEEIAGQLPPTDEDFAHLTVAQWERIKATSYQIPAAAARTTLNLTLTADMRVRIVPHPTDRWTMLCGRTFTVDWTGTTADDETFHASRTDRDREDGTGSLRVWLDDGAPQRPGVITGPGRVSVGPHRPEPRGQGQGYLRIKVITLTDE